ncbi:MAG: hypothetical protein ACTJFR_02705 [Canibacter sp.]
MSGTRFSMDQQTLVTLGQRTETESDDLGTLVRNFIEAAEPISGSFNGPARSAFNSFKGNADGISTMLNSALQGVLGSIVGQNRAFTEGMTEGAESHKANMGGADWSSEGVLHRLSGGAGGAV